MNADRIPFVPTRDDLIGFISDGEKEIWGFRPRVNWSEISYEELDKWGRKLSAELTAHRKQSVIRDRIERKLRTAEQKLWTEKKRGYFKPVSWSIGDLVAL